jgi:hypothetical protein
VLNMLANFIKIGQTVQELLGNRQTTKENLLQENCNRLMEKIKRLGYSSPQAGIKLATLHLQGRHATFARLAS